MKHEPGRNDGACWQNDGFEFFEQAWNGTDCSRNWYTGNRGGLGQSNGGPTKAWVSPHFTAAAPALLGFDRNINWHCHGTDFDHAEACTKRNVNILSLYGEEIPYSVCRNLEWQVCAAKGTLPGQKSSTIIFSMPPKDLQVQGGDFPLGSCSSYAPFGCGGGYASGDIFYLEVCVYDAMCANRNAMWALNAGDPWHCELDYWGFKEFFEKILNTPSEEVAAMDLKWAFPTGPRKEERQQQRQWADDDGW